MNSQQEGSIICPLCLACGAVDYASDRARSYLQCPQCCLVFVTPDQHLSCEDEKAIYDQHQNSPDDQNYRRFLSRLTVPLLDRIKPQSQGLDFGCGPGPTLSVMMAEQGHQMAPYDIYYADHPLVLQAQYDFIFQPLDFIAKLAALVPKPRVNLTRFHGVFAPNSKHRGQITPAKRGKKTTKVQAGGADWLDKSQEEQHRAMTWMQRLKRVFNIDIETCERCGGKVKVIASIEDPAVIAHILKHLKQKEARQAGLQPHELPLERAPPQSRLFDPSRSLLFD